MTDTTAEATDGRRARRLENRQAVVQALADLYCEGTYEPSTAEIAARAGISERSLFRYFDDAADLVRATVAHHHELARPLLVLDVDPLADLGARIEQVVAARARMWDVLAPSARVVRMRAPVQPILAGELAERRSLLRRQLADAFAPELAAMDATRRGATLGAVDVLCSFESYDLLRNDQRLSRAKACASIASALAAVLG